MNKKMGSKLIFKRQLCFEWLLQSHNKCSIKHRVINSVDSFLFTARLNSSKDNLLHSPRAQLEDSLFMPSIVYCVLFSIHLGPRAVLSLACFQLTMNVLVHCLTSYKTEDNQTQWNLNIGEQTPIHYHLIQGRC